MTKLHRNYFLVLLLNLFIPTLSFSSGSEIKEHPGLYEASYEQSLPECPANPRIQSLYNHCDFRRKDATAVSFVYSFNTTQQQELKDKYRLDVIAGNGDTQERAIRLLNWLSQNTFHKSLFGFSQEEQAIPKSALAYMDYVFQNQDRGANCAVLSNLLAECYLAVGIKARPVTLFPEDPNDLDCHVVTLAYIPEKSKWIMVDPTWNAYFMDEKGEVLSPWEIRKKLIRSETMKINESAEYNGKKCDDAKDIADYFDYIAKNSFYYGTPLKAGYEFAQDDDNIRILLCPQHMDYSAWIKAYDKYVAHQIKDVILKSPDCSSDELEKILDEVYEPLRKKIISQKIQQATFESFWGE